MRPGTDKKNVSTHERKLTFQLDLAYRYASALHCTIDDLVTDNLDLMTLGLHSAPEHYIDPQKLLQDSEILSQRMEEVGIKTSYHDYLETLLEVYPVKEEDLSGKMLRLVFKAKAS